MANGDGDIVQKIVLEADTEDATSSIQKFGQTVADAFTKAGASVSALDFESLLPGLEQIGALATGAALGLLKLADSAAKSAEAMGNLQQPSEDGGS